MNKIIALVTTWDGLQYERETTEEEIKENKRKGYCKYYNSKLGKAVFNFE